MEFGGLRGLTFDTGQDKLIQDLMYQDQMLQRKRVEDAAMAQKLAGDIEYLKGSNQYDAKILEKEGQQLLKEIGDMRNSAGSNWQSDPNFWANLNYKKQQLKNSKAAIRSVAYQNALGEYQKFAQLAQRNPSKYNLDQLEKAKSMFDNYGKDEYGNYLPDDKVEPIRFDPPEEIPNLEEMHMKEAAALSPDDFKKLNNGRDDAYIGTVSDKKVKQIAELLYNENKSAYDYVLKEFPDKIDTIAKRLKAGTKTIREKGTRNPVNDALAIEAGRLRLKKQLEGGEEQKQPKSLYDVAFYNQDRASYGHDILSGAFTKTPTAYFMGADGKPQQVPVDAEVIYDGDFYDEGASLGKGRNHVFHAPLKAYLPLKTAIDAGMAHDPFTLGGDWGDNEYQPTKAYEEVGKVVMRDNGKGKQIPMFEISAEAIIDGNSEIYRNKVNQGMTAKLRSMLGSSPVEYNQPTRTNVPTGTREQFKAKGWSDDMINRYSMDGSIIVK